MNYEYYQYYVYVLHNIYLINLKFKMCYLNSFNLNNLICIIFNLHISTYIHKYNINHEIVIQNLIIKKILIIYYIYFTNHL